MSDVDWKDKAFQYAKQRNDLTRKCADLEAQLKAMSELCHAFYNAGVSAGHPMTSYNTAKRDLEELEEELKQLKGKS